MTSTLNFSSLMPIFSIGSRIGTPSGNRRWTSRTLFHSVSLAWSDRRSLGMNTRMWLMPSIVDNKTERTRGTPFWPGRQGCTPLGVGVRLDRSLSLEMALPDAQLRRTSTTYCSCGGSSSGFGPNLFCDEVYQSSDV